MNASNNDKNKFLLTAIAVIIIGGMAAFGYQMYEHNSRVVESSRIDIPDNEGSSGDWIKYTGSNSCPIFVEQRFDANKSHYRCMYQR